MGRKIANLIHHQALRTRSDATSAAFCKIWIEGFTAKREERISED